jgi:hypothetical protein
MSIAASLAPMFAQVLLVVILSVVMAKRRAGAMRSNEVKTSALVGDANAWPKVARLAANSFHNQFEFPILFYVLTILAVVTKQADVLFVWLAWLFVATRYLHAFIHVTSNRMSHRFYAFIAGVTVLTVMWIRFAAQIFMAG